MLMVASSQTANDLMAVFSDTVTAGFSALSGPVNGIFGLMIALVIALTGIQWAVSANRDVLASAFAKILLIGSFAYLINDWQALSETIFAGFLQLGLDAGGGSISPADFLNPGAIIETGWEIVRKIGDAPTTTQNPLDVIGNLIDALIIGISMIGIMVAFAVLALQIIVTLLEFKIVTLGGFILLPFGIWSKSAFMAERPLGYVVSAGLKVLALAIVVSGAQAIFAQLTPSPAPDIYEALTLLTASIILAMLSVFAPNLAAALVTGGPTLGAGALGGGALAIGGSAGLAGAAIAGTGSTIAGMGSQIASGFRAAAGASTGSKPSTGPRIGPSGGPSGGPQGSPSGGTRSTSSRGLTVGRSGGSLSGSGKTSAMPSPGPALARSGTSSSPSVQNGNDGEPNAADSVGHNSPKGSVEPTPKSGPAPQSGSTSPSGLGTRSGPQSGPRDTPQGNQSPAVAPKMASQAGQARPASNPSGSTSSPSAGFHSFPARGASATPLRRAQAFNTYATANLARQIMPANENAGALHPSIKEED